MLHKVFVIIFVSILYQQSSNTGNKLNNLDDWKHLRMIEFIQMKFV